MKRNREVKRVLSTPLGLLLSLALACGGSNGPTSPSVGATLNIVQKSLPEGAVQAAYAVALQATGGTAPITWRVSSQSLPDGLSLDQRVGTITGTPTRSGMFSFEIQAIDSANPAQTDTAPFGISISGPPVNIAGTWAGTLSGEFIPIVAPDQTLDTSMHTIGFTFKQSGSVVSGDFIRGEKRTAVSGTILGTQFHGSLSLPTGDCANSGDFSGTVSADNLEWTGSFKPTSGFGLPCVFELPQGLATIVAARETR
jgi:hypothetical protein